MLLHVAGVQPHLFGVIPPPHVWGATQGSPQSVVEPQPSDTLPQSPAAQARAWQGVVPHL
jgi:hypothetical protein